MKLPFQNGDIKTYQREVLSTDIATFESGTVHPVYSTFSIARDAEWSGRLFVLDMKEEEEEGIGTFIHVDHKSPAFVGETVVFYARFEEITERNEIITSFVAKCQDRIIASGRQGQKILPKQRIQELLNQVKPE